VAKVASYEWEPRWEKTKLGPLLHRNGLALRIHFQETPRDLQIALGYAIAVGTVLLYFGVGTFLAVFLVFIIPGYLFVAMLFP